MKASQRTRRRRHWGGAGRIDGTIGHSHSPRTVPAVDRAKSSIILIEGGTRDDIGARPKGAFGERGWGRRASSYPFAGKRPEQRTNLTRLRACAAVCGSALCNLYTLTKGQAAIRDWFRARHDHTGNLPLFASIFPGQMAPIVRNGTNGARELVMARWGMPGPPPCGGQPVTNIRKGMFPATSTRPRASLALTGSCR
jgi:hypothetical protein